MNIQPIFLASIIFALFSTCGHNAALHSTFQNLVMVWQVASNCTCLVKLIASCLQVKAVYVKNLPKDITQDQLKDLFEHHGKITKVVLPPAKPGQEKSRYGFVHFAERSSAMKALKNTEKYEIGGNSHFPIFPRHLFLDYKIPIGITLLL